jgi:hypothetical protein
MQVHIIDITIDDFIRLGADQHLAAIEHYDEQISALAENDTLPGQRQLTMCYELRRLHQARHADLLTKTGVSHPQVELAYA